MASLSRILVPVEFSPRCEMAARHAKALAAHFHAEITLLHVVVPVVAYGAPEALAYSAALDVAEDRAALAKAHMDNFLPREFGVLTVERVIREGDPAQGIVACAAERQSDLIVLPTHGYGPFRRFLLGSVTAKVLHDATCPVWIGPHLEKAPAEGEMRLRQVVCGVDLGPESAAVLKWAGELAHEFNAHLTVVHAIPESTVHLEGVYFDPDFRVQVANAARVQIEGLMAEAGAQGNIVFEAGAPADALAAAASGLHADVVVIGRKGHHTGVLGRLRTHSYAIVREAPCPVAAV
jgi:nucleotide-binding universal stress UspA family protein